MHPAAVFLVAMFTPSVIRQVDLILPLPLFYRLTHVSPDESLPIITLPSRLAPVFLERCRPHHAVTNTTGYVFPALPLSRHNLPFTLPRFLVPPRVNSPCRFGCLLRPSPLCRRPHPIISGRPRPSLIIVNVIRPRAIDGDDESRPLGWFTRRFSTTRCSAAIVDCHPCRPGTPWPSLPPSLTHPDQGQAQSTPPGVLLLLTKLPPSRPSSSPAGHQSRRCHYLARSPESRQPPPLVPIGTRPSLPLALRHREQQVAARCDSLYDP